MGVSTKKGDQGYTSLLTGERVPKHHLATEAVGVVDEANSQLGLARASCRERRIKRILLQVQRHLFVVGAELSSVGEPSRALKKVIGRRELQWLDYLVEEYEQALDLPPGFVAFGQEESSAQLDVARTSVRKAERLASKMNSEGMIQNPYLLKYLNRLSDLVFLLASFEEREQSERRQLSRDHFPAKWRDPLFRKWTLALGSLALALIIVIVLLLLFHGQTFQSGNYVSPAHTEAMEKMHRGQTDK